MLFIYYPWLKVNRVKDELAVGCRMLAFHEAMLGRKKTTNIKTPSKDRRTLLYTFWDQVRMQKKILSCVRWWTHGGMK